MMPPLQAMSVFMYYFTCISFAIRPSGRKSAIKLMINRKLTAYLKNVECTTNKVEIF